MTYNHFKALLEIAKAKDKDEFAAFHQENQAARFQSCTEKQAAAVWEFANDPSVNTILRLSGRKKAAFFRKYDIPPCTFADWSSGRSKARIYTSNLLAFAVISEIE